MKSSEINDLQEKEWSERRDLNPRPLVPQTSTPSDIQELTGDFGASRSRLDASCPPDVLSQGSVEPERASSASAPFRVKVELKTVDIRHYAATKPDIVSAALAKRLAASFPSGSAARALRNLGLEVT
jgi:hypothetical protein